MGKKSSMVSIVYSAIPKEPTPPFLGTRLSAANNARDLLPERDIEMAKLAGLETAEGNPIDPHALELENDLLSFRLREVLALIACLLLRDQFLNFDGLLLDLGSGELVQLNRVGLRPDRLGDMLQRIIYACCPYHEVPRVIPRHASPL